MEQSSIEGARAEQSKFILRCLLKCSGEAICPFPRGNHCQSKSFLDKELNLSPGKVALSPVTPETQTAALDG